MVRRVLSNKPEEIEVAEVRADKKGFAMGAMFVCAIAVLLMLAGLVINILSEEKTYRDKWKDYDDYGWS